MLSEYCKLFRSVNIILQLLLFLRLKIQGLPVIEKPPPNFVGIYGKYFEGDIILPKNPRAVISQNGLFHTWPEGKMYYQFSDSYDSNDKLLITKGCMGMISDHTCIRFIEGKAPDGSYVEFVTTHPEACFSDLGKVGGRQELNLPRGCFYNQVGVCAHEIIHALGVFHEQTRPDRDKYIKLNEENIEPDAIGQFDIRNPLEVDSFGSYYDYKSIMHYEQTGFGKKNRLGQLLNTFEPTRLFTNPGVT